MCHGLLGERSAVVGAGPGKASPEPNALANQGKKTHTDEYAVMLDGLNPIQVLAAGESVEWKEYWASWMDRKPAEPVQSR